MNPPESMAATLAAVAIVLVFLFFIYCILVVAGKSDR